MKKIVEFKKDDKVKIVNCYEASFDKNKDKIWICRDNSFISQSGKSVVFLEGYSGYFCCEFLEKVND